MVPVVDPDALSFLIRLLRLQYNGKEAAKLGLQMAARLWPAAPQLARRT